MRVLVLGASGFVGQHVVRTLLERATHEVWSASRSGTFKVDVSRAVACDVEDEESLRSAIEASRCDLVVNLAGVYAWWLPDPDAFERVNVQGVRNLLSAVRSCAGRSPRLVHVSTVLAYGRPEGLGAGDAFDEDSPVGPTTSRYAASKQAGDLLVQAALESGDVAGSACYLACCIGADQKCVSPDRDVMRIADLISGAVPATIASDAVFTYVSVRDAAEAIARVGERACASGGGLTCRRRRVPKARLERRVRHARPASSRGVRLARGLGRGQVPGRRGPCSCSPTPACIHTWQVPSGRGPAPHGRILRRAAADLRCATRPPRGTYATATRTLARRGSCDHHTIAANGSALAAGTPKPKREVPGWVAMLGARVLTWYANNLTGSMPTAPVDLVRTATSGTLLFDASRSTAELGSEPRVRHASATRTQRASATRVRHALATWPPRTGRVVGPHHLPTGRAECAAVHAAYRHCILTRPPRGRHVAAVQYAPIKDALVEAIDFITERTTNPDGRALRDAEAMADARVRLLETD